MLGAFTPAVTVAVKLYLVAVNGGQPGETIGCGDRLVGIERQVAKTPAILRAAIEALLSLGDRAGGAPGLYNALSASRLAVQRIAIVDGVAEIRLSGALTPAGACDAPRIAGQLERTALQFPSVRRARILVNDVPLETALSAK
jgi:hypothetical protein